MVAFLFIKIEELLGGSGLALAPQHALDIRARMLSTPPDVELHIGRAKHVDGKDPWLWDLTSLTGALIYKIGCATTPNQSVSYDINPTTAPRYHDPIFFSV